MHRYNVWLPSLVTADTTKGKESLAAIVAPPAVTVLVAGYDYANTTIRGIWFILGDASDGGDRQLLAVVARFNDRTQHVLPYVVSLAFLAPL
ncbi:hypothetical protein M8C21_027684 [Ambrosia artemisiifolia]|uniref:Uncharacterized protein n=1 Tax=Ambrosia artemisiifolia TaxID=4212 RepID=A0AAD5D803_AMBAR|nr:hypothetical protein M8C21_027684 [Ambrosia artemisiifolia]